MAKFRMVNTKFWSDPFIQDLAIQDKLLFLYFLTNEHTNICGFYEISLRTIEFETGVKKTEIIQSLDRLRQSGRVCYIDGFLHIKNFIRHQIDNPSVRAGIERELSKIPNEIKDKVQTAYTLGTDCESLAYLTKLNLTKLNLTKKVGEQKKSAHQLTILEDQNFLDTLKTNPAYKHINVEHELSKMDSWLSVNKHRKKTKRFIVNWLNRASDQNHEIMKGNNAKSATQTLVEWANDFNEEAIPAIDSFADDSIS